VSYCATCDGAFFKEKITVVVGGGDAALEEADFLTRFADKVYLVHRRDQFRGAEILQKRVFNNKKIIPILNTIVESINGEGKVGSVLLKDNVSGETKVLDTDGVFVFVGFNPNSAFLDGKLLNANKEIIVDASMQTEIPGLFAAGDIRSGSKRQIVTAAADGATAALNVYEYLKEN
jgi:thioredoxin reductase (NADPH)